MRAMRVRDAMLVVALVGCGRIAFDPRVDSPPAPNGGFGNVVELALPPSADPQLSADSLELWLTLNVPSKTLALLMRPTTDATFGTPVPEPIFDTVYEEIEGAITADNLDFMFVENFNLLRESRRATPSDAWGPPSQVAGIDTSRVGSFDLSRDGLVIYFEGGDGILMRASRPNRASPFDAPVAIVAPFVTFMTVSADELSLFGNRDRGEPTSILWATRSRADEPFVEQGSLALGTNCRDPDISPTGDALVLMCNEAAYILTR
jgi:hypothetical protein